MANHQDTYAIFLLTISRLLHNWSLGLYNNMNTVWQFFFDNVFPWKLTEAVVQHIKLKLLCSEPSLISISFTFRWGSLSKVTGISSIFPIQLCWRQCFVIKFMDIDLFFVDFCWHFFLTVYVRKYACVCMCMCDACVCMCDVCVMCVCVHVMRAYACACDAHICMCVMHICMCVWCTYAYACDARMCVHAMHVCVCIWCAYVMQACTSGCLGVRVRVWACMFGHVRAWACECAKMLVCCRIDLGWLCFWQFFKIVNSAFLKKIELYTSLLENRSWH